MKRSNLLLLILSVLFLSGLLLTDNILAHEYTKINLHEPFKNFESIDVKPFRKLRISGGNGYAIEIKQGDHYNIKLMKSRKSFFKMVQVNDTLVITFTVASQKYQQPSQCTTGLVIFLPALDYLDLSGTNNEVGPLKMDSLRIHQNENTNTRLKELQLNYLGLKATGRSYFDLESQNETKHFAIDLTENAVANFQNISFNQFTPFMQDSAAIVINKKSLESIYKSKAPSNEPVSIHP